MTLLKLKWEVGDRMRKARLHAGVSIEAIAEEVGQSPSTVRAWERNANTPRNLYDVTMVYERLTDVSWAWIMSGNEDTARPDAEAAASRTYTCQRTPLLVAA
jgi:transcriptional regulator with XRE-family HTH domain